MKENSREEDMNYLDSMVKEYKQFDDLYNEDYEDEDRIYQALEHILSDYKRVLEMNEVLLKENEILLKENEELKKNYINVRDNVNTTFCKVAIPPEPQLPTKTLCESFSKKVRNK